MTMSRRFTVLTVALTAAVAFLVGLILAGGLTPAPVVSSAPRVPQPAAGVPRPALLGNAPSVVNFADVAERINASVVNIEAASKTSAPREPPRYFRRGDGPIEGPAPPRDFETPRQGAGSGFIIDRGGFILTNYHVIEAAERITVTLADGRAFRGEVVGTDPAIDVALLRIDGGPGLPEAPLGNSDELRVGEWVCAIGNPLGYVHSVTVGVVSFIGRKLFDQSLDDYIQTDAAINFGNSGGPLINTRGEVIGINSAISSRASNIGFAVPINQAVAILPQLKTRGRVARGFMGVGLTDVTPSLQRSLNLQVSEGALVQDVSTGSPAERAGLKPYDVIVEVEGRAIVTNEELIRDISARQPGTVARLEVVREARRQSLVVKLAERPLRDEANRSGIIGDRGAARPPAPSVEIPLGLTVRELDRTFVDRLQIPGHVQGVVVSRVDPTGAAFSAQIRRGFVIIEINRRPVRSVADYERIVSAARPGDVLAIYHYDPAVQQRALVAVAVDQ
jgi:serine protease Do